ncbi:MAG: hypothetical protein IT178_07335 [Acidobacteria bacterium]|nr:hypothetical protein [Acidobacteriota bacterium]
MTPLPQPVTFPNKAGHRLFGMLHAPAQPRAGAPAILLLSPGVKMRVAPHRLYLRMAEEFAAAGHLVLRFDFEGLGDAEGDVPEALLTDLYGAIQTGRYVDDTMAAMDWMESAYGSRRFVAAGLCGGAITGLLTATRDDRVTALLALAIPVVVEGSHSNPIQHMTSGELAGIRQSYFSKLQLWRASTWQAIGRFLIGQSDYRLLWRSLTAPLQSRVRGPAAAAPTDGSATPGDNSNPRFAPALFAMLERKRPVLMIFAGNDRLHWEFEEKFANRQRERLAAAGSYTIHITPQANHIFSLPEWQDDMLAQCRTWLAAQ